MGHSFSPALSPFTIHREQVMRGLIRALSTQAGLGLAILRVVMGLIFMYSGYRKVFGGGFAIGYFKKLGIPVAEVMGPFVSFLELGGGALLIAGLFSRYVGVLFVIEFIVASYFRFLGGGLPAARLELLLVAGAIVLVTNGAGALGLDRSEQR